MFRRHYGRKNRIAVHTMSVLLSMLIAISTMSANAFAGTNGHSQQDAVNWATARGNEKWCQDVDGAYGCQCVDLILAYYKYLTGGTKSGNACDYRSNALPSGWKRVYSNPQAGDIVVWGPGVKMGWSPLHTEYANSSFGHIGIVWRVNSGGTISTIETNTLSGSAAAYKERYASTAACYIRPDFNTHKHTYTSSVTKQATCTAAGTRTYKCSCGNSYTESIAAIGHKYNHTVVAPTTSSKGYTKHTCSVCGHTYNDNYTDPIKEVDGWTVSSALPSDVNADKYEIQYNNYYEKTQTASPGTGWTNVGTVKTEWKNSGSRYTSATDLATSEARVLVSSVYYHFCGPNAGNEGNYEQTGKFVHWDSIDASKVTAKYLGTDNGHPYYFVYLNGQQLSCHSGTTCDGSYGSHGNRCKAWYKQNTYQNRTKVTTFKFTKESGWTTTKDSAANKVTYRYRLKQAPHVHNYTSTVKEPSYESEGIRTFKCSCGNTYTEKIEKLIKPAEEVPEIKDDDIAEDDGQDVSNKDDAIDTSEAKLEKTESPSEEKAAKEKTLKAMIVKNTPKQVNLTRAVGGKKKLTVYWARLPKNTKSYQIEIKNKKTKKTTKVTVKQTNKKKMSKTVKKLGKGNYTVRIRGINKYGKKNLYGKWSKTKAVKVR